MIYRIGIAILCLSFLAACVPATGTTLPAAAPTGQPAPATAVPTPYTEPPAQEGASQPKETMTNPSPLAPLPDENNMVRGQAFVDTSALVTLKSNPEQYALNVSGSLPTPCNVLKYDIKGPDDQNRIEVELYSLVPTDKMCAQVLKPFETTIQLGSLKSGKFAVSLNGSPVGDITVP